MIKALIFDLDNCLAPATEVGQALYAPAFDAIDEPDRLGKKGLFEKIIADNGYQQTEVLIVGDNEDSEIEAGNALGIQTVQTLRPGVPLDQEDPDVRRLIEAMAIFTARTRLAGTRHINARHRQILLQYFPFLLTPLPAMALAQAVLTGQLAEAVFID